MVQIPLGHELVRVFEAVGVEVEVGGVAEEDGAFGDDVIFVYDVGACELTNSGC